MCQPKSKLQGFDFEAKRKRRFSFCVRSKNPGGVFRATVLKTPQNHPATIISFSSTAPSAGWL
jgi:hypothetical protein